MASKIKNIIIFTVIAACLILIYIFFIKKAPEEQNLTSSLPIDITSNTTETVNQNSVIAKDLLLILLSVKSIKLNDLIFSDSAFLNLHDSSILLVPSGDEGRPNPFAPIGYEALTAPPVIPIAPPTLSPTIIDSSIIPSKTEKDTKKTP